MISVTFTVLFQLDNSRRNGPVSITRTRRNFLKILVRFLADEVLNVGFVLCDHACMQISLPGTDVFLEHVLSGWILSTMECSSWKKSAQQLAPRDDARAKLCHP